MHRARTVLLVLAAMLVAGLLATGQAAAATTTIDADGANDTAWRPASVTIPAGDTVRWEFDEANAPHNVVSSSDNWTLEQPRRHQGPGRRVPRSTTRAPTRSCARSTPAR